MALTGLAECTIGQLLRVHDSIRKVNARIISNTCCVVLILTDLELCRSVWARRKSWLLSAN